MTDPIAPPPDLPDDEVVLLRQQLAGLAALFSERAQTALPPRAAEESQLLKDLLAALIHDMTPPEPAPPRPAASRPAAPPPGTGPRSGTPALEAALAHLLAELIRESDLRLQAQAEAVRARALLRRHGLDSRPTAARVPVASRRGL